MTNEIAPKLVMKLTSGAPIYIFTIQARPSEYDETETELGERALEPGADDRPLALEKIEAARNAAVAALDLVGVEIDSTSSVLTIDAPSETARLVLTPTVESTSELAIEQAETENENQEPSETKEE